MRLLVCGGRDYGWDDKEHTSRDDWEIGYLYAYLDLTLVVEEEISDKVETLIVGGATGADTWAEKWGRWIGLNVEVYPADWKKYAFNAGPIRNHQMLITGIDLVIAFPGGKGTKDMVKKARAKGVTVIEVYLPDYPA